MSSQFYRTLASQAFKPHIWTMPMMTKKTVRPDGSAEVDREVVYRGIRIAPIGGKRSPLAQAIREGLRAKYEQHRGDPVRS